MFFLFCEVGIRVSVDTSAAILTMGHMKATSSTIITRWRGCLCCILVSWKTNIFICLIFCFHLDTMVVVMSRSSSEETANDSSPLLLQSQPVHIHHPSPDPQQRGAPSHLGGEPLCLSKRLHYGGSGSGHHLPHPPLTQFSCILHPWYKKIKKVFYNT